LFSRQECRQAEVYKNLLIGDWLILCSREQAFERPPRTASTLLHANHRQQKNIFKDLEVLLAVELGL
jgi:hypothetical protein